MPCNDALSLAGLDALEHLAEECTAWRLGAEGLLVDSDDFDVPPRGNQALHFAALGFDGDDLAVFIFAGFSAVEEVSHGIHMSICCPSPDSRRSGSGDARRA